MIEGLMRPAPPSIRFILRYAAFNHDGRKIVSRANDGAIDAARRTATIGKIGKIGKKALCDRYRAYLAADE